MAEATREFAIAKTMEILRAYVRKIEDARGYFDCLSPEGRRIVENYDNNVDGQKTLLLDACNNDKFFSGMTDEMVIAYADVCRKLNDRFDLNVKKVYPIEKITADLSLFEKIKKAIGYSDILGEILEEVGDINALVKQMALVSGGLIALSFTGLGTVAEALGLALLLVGASFSGTELLAGITGLVKFFTEVYNAKTENDLKDCGKLFGDAVAKIGVNGLFFVLSLFGLKKASIRHTTRTIAESKPVSGKWTWKSFKENVLKIGDGEKTKSIDSNVTPKTLLRFNETRCHAHLIYGDGIKPGQGGVNGAHNKNNFYKTINDKFEPIFNKEGLKFNINECIENRAAHPTISGIEEIRYKLPAMNQNNTLNKGIYKKIKNPKTVYDPSVISDEKMIQWGKEAMENGKSVTIGNKIIGTCSNGLKFIGYLDEHGAVKNFYPVLNAE